MTEHATELIEEYFTGRLSPAGWEVLVTHLRGCEICRKEYELRRAPLLEAEGRDPEDRDPTNRELEISEKLLVQRLAEIKASEEAASVAVFTSVSEPPPPARKPTKNNAPRFAAYATGIAALAAGAFMLVGGEKPDTGDGPETDLGYSARKSTGKGAVLAEVVCVQVVDGTGKSTGIVKDKGSCSYGNYVTLRVQSFSSAFGAVTGVFTTEPNAPEVIRGRLAKNERSVVPDKEHEPVPLGEHGTTIVALFSTRELSEGESRELAASSRLDFRRAGPQVLAGVTELPRLADGTRVAARVIRIEVLAGTKEKLPQ
jgi:hypothetical protein